MCVTSLLYYSSSDQYLLENMALYVTDWSHVAEICSYRTQISTVIHTLRFAICRDSAAQDDSLLPLMGRSSCYLSLASLFWNVRIRLRRLTSFHCFQQRPLTGWSEIQSLIFRKFLVDAARFVVGAMQPLTPPRLGPDSISALAREMDFLGLSMKSLPNTTHIFICLLIPPRKALFPTMPFLIKLLA